MIVQVLSSGSWMFSPECRALMVEFFPTFFKSLLSSNFLSFLARLKKRIDLLYVFTLLCGRYHSTPVHLTMVLEIKHCAQTLKLALIPCLNVVQGLSQWEKDGDYDVMYKKG